MAHWLRYGWPRRIILKLAVLLDRGRIHDVLTEFLYPNDLRIRFD